MAPKKRRSGCQSLATLVLDLTCSRIDLQTSDTDSNIFTHSADTPLNLIEVVSLSVFRAGDRPADLCESQQMRRLLDVRPLRTNVKCAKRFEGPLMKVRREVRSMWWGGLRGRGRC